jgi:hypothetical protein
MKLLTFKERNRLKIEFYSENVSEIRKSEILNMLKNDEAYSVLRDFKSEYEDEG